jgi:hypothetical protein
MGAWIDTLVVVGDVDAGDDASMKSFAVLMMPQQRRWQTLSAVKARRCLRRDTENKLTEGSKKFL